MVMHEYEEPQQAVHGGAELSWSTPEEVLAWASGAGDSSLSERARAWVAKQQNGAMVAERTHAQHLLR
jgi:hypothetical protein